MLGGIRVGHAAQLLNTHDLVGHFGQRHYLVYLTYLPGDLKADPRAPARHKRNFPSQAIHSERRLKGRAHR